MTEDRPDASDDVAQPPQDEGQDAPDPGDAADERQDAPGEREPHDPHDDPRLPTHVASALCYILSFASGIVMLMLEQEDRSVRFHAFQSILLGAVCLVLTVGVVILGWIPPLGWLLGDILRWIVGFAWLLVSVFLMLKAYSGEDYRLPYLGSRASRLASPLD